MDDSGAKQLAKLTGSKDPRINLANLVKIICDNCLMEGHTSNQCTKERDPVATKKNRDERLRREAARKDGGKGGGSDSTKRQYTQLKKVSGQGANAVYAMSCKLCSKFCTDHSTRYHKLWASAKRDGRLFNLADHSPMHPLVTSNGLQPSSSTPATVPKTQPTLSDTDTAALNARIATLKTSIDDPSLLADLHAMEATLVEKVFRQG